MQIFESETELLSTLDRFDQLILDSISGRISFPVFLEQYGDFYMFYALDGHESDLEETAILDAHKDRIELHREVWDRILGAGLSSDEDAAKPEYAEVGRFGNAEGLRRLRTIGQKYFPTKKADR